MPKLPDLEGLAIFAKVVEHRSLVAAAKDLKLSKATVSKAVARIEARLGTRLINRTSRRLALTDTGRTLVARAAHILAEGEAAESDAQAQSLSPRGLVRLAAPMSFGIRHVAPLLPEFLATYPDISVDLHLSDAMVDLIGEGFDAAIRIAVLPDSSLVARRLCAMTPYLIGAPAYFERRGKPRHPLQLADHACFGYAYQLTPDSWHFRKTNGERATVRPAGPLRVNNGDAMLPAILAGVGLGVLPDFIVRDAIADGRVEVILPEWSLPSGAVHWVTPPGGPKPRRLELLAEFMASRLARRSDSTSAPRSAKRRAD